MGQKWENIRELETAAHHGVVARLASHVMILFFFSFFKYIYTPHRVTETHSGTGK